MSVTLEEISNHFDTESASCKTITLSLDPSANQQRVEKSNGWTYFGDMDPQTHLLNGYGAETLDKKVMYAGSYKNSLKDGIGAAFQAGFQAGDGRSGGVYSGAWSKGQKHGKGR